MSISLSEQVIRWWFDCLVNWWTYKSDYLLKSHPDKTEYLAWNASLRAVPIYCSLKGLPGGWHANLKWHSWAGED